MHRCQCALLLHGGHDMVFKNNLIIEKCEKSGKSINIVRYGYWKTLVKDGQDNQHWQALARVPWESQIWREKYPHIAEYLTWDPETEQNIPHYSDISNNLIVDHCKISINFNILEERLKSAFATIWKQTAFAGILEGDKLDLSNIRIRIIPGFEDIPFGKMGIQMRNTVHLCIDINRFKITHYKGKETCMKTKIFCLVIALVLLLSASWRRIRHRIHRLIPKRRRKP